MQKYFTAFVVAVALGIAAELPAQVIEYAPPAVIVPTVQPAMPMPFPAAVQGSPIYVSGGYSPSFGSDAIQSLHDPRVHKDLEIVDEQLEQIEEIRRNFSEKTQAIVKRMSEGGTDQRY